MINNTISFKTASIAAIIAMLASPLGSFAQTSQATLPGTTTVTIGDNFYSPQNVTIPVGGSVTWHNSGQMSHTVTFNNIFLSSGTLTPGSSFTATFNSPGTYYYHCQFHPGMTGVVTVTNQPNYSLSGTVSQAPSSQIIINSITPIKTNAIADGTFQNGWQWVFDLSVPLNEQNLSMKFNNWVMQNGGTIAAANNMRFYSSQSSNANSQNNAIYITAPNTYSQPMLLTGNLGGAPSGMRRVQVMVEMRVPQGSQLGTYSTGFGIQTY